MDILEFTCPEDCSNAGNCDTSTGECSCFSGRHGIDCSSKYLFKTKTIQKQYNSPTNLFPTEFDCPGDGDCSNQGTCDESSGTCLCDEGFEGDMCQGKKVYKKCKKG